MGWVEGKGRHLGLERTCQGLAPLFDHNCCMCVCVCMCGEGGGRRREMVREGQTASYYPLLTQKTAGATEYTQPPVCLP